MKAVEQEEPADAVAGTAPVKTKVPRKRQTDGGPEILPNMAHFVALVRKCKRTVLLTQLLERHGCRALPELVQADGGGWSTQTRRTLFEYLRQELLDRHAQLNAIAERVILLDDPYGAQATDALLHEDVDQEILMSPTDRCSKALYLYLRQEHPAPGQHKDSRFDNAERLQVLHRQWKSEAYASHYLGPQGAAFQFDGDIEVRLRQRIASLFPHVPADQILIEHFTRQEARGNADDGDDAPHISHTLTAIFNGTVAHFQQVAGGEVVEHEEPAATSASFSWDPGTGSLSVFCEDREVRAPLAQAFRDEVLACDGDIRDMPVLEFDLLGFASPEMLRRIDHERIHGIERISILQLRITRLINQRFEEQTNDRTIHQQLASTALVTRDSRDLRDIYAVAYDDFGLDDLSGYALSQVKLTFRMATQPSRRAHNVSVQITAPNGLTHRMTEDDRRRVFEQLRRLGVLRML